MADNKDTKQVYVAGATDGTALLSALGLSESGAEVRVFKTGAIVTIDLEKADAILAAGTISIDGTSFKVTLPRERPAKPVVPARPQGQVEKPKTAPKPEAAKAPVTVQPSARPPLSRPPAGPSKDELAERRKQLDEREAALNKRTESLGAKERWLDGREKAQKVRNSALATYVAASFAEFYPGLADKLVEVKRLITGSNAGVEVAISAIKGTLLSDLERSADESKPAIRGALSQFLGEVSRLQSAAHASNPESPKATIGEAQLAKEQGRKGNKAKRERNAPATTETPDVPATPPTTESTPAAAQQ